MYPHPNSWSLDDVTLYSKRDFEDTIKTLRWKVILDYLAQHNHKGL